MRTQTTLGDLISVLFDEYMEIYNDEELASVAVAATVNDMFASGEAVASRGDPEAERAA